MRFGKKNLFVLFLLGGMLLMGCGYEGAEENTDKMNNKTENTAAEDSFKVLVTAGGKEFNAVFYKNETSEDLAEKIPFTLKMNDLNGNEKYYYFDETFPESSQKVESIKIGDIMLYGDSCIVIFYKSFNTNYSYTKIGYIENAEELEKALGNSDIKVKFEIYDKT